MIKKRTIRGQNSRPGETDPYFFQFEIFHFCVQTIEIFVGKTKYSMVKEASNVKISICNFGTNTPGTRGGPGGRDRTLAVKSRKTPEISFLAQAALHAPPEVALQCIAGHCY